MKYFNLNQMPCSEQENKACLRKIQDEIGQKDVAVRFVKFDETKPEDYYEETFPDSFFYGIDLTEKQFNDLSPELQEIYNNLKTKNK